MEELIGRSELVARRLGLLGRVNLLAGGELESVQERHDFLIRELEDVKGARRDIERLIEDIETGYAGFSRGGRKKAGEDSHRRRFSGAVLAEEPDNFAFTDFEGDVLDGDMTRVSLGQTKVVECCRNKDHFTVIRHVIALSQQGSKDESPHAVVVEESRTSGAGQITCRQRRRRIGQGDAGNILGQAGR